MRFKPIATGLIVAGSLAVVGCSDVNETKDGNTPMKSEQQQNSKSYDLGVADAKDFVDNGGGTLKDACDIIVEYQLTEGFEPEEWCDGFLSEVSFGEKNTDTDVEDKETMLEYFNLGLDDVKESLKEQKLKDKQQQQKQEKDKEGQCYDCGEYYPVDSMKFNGRSYHCGCVACEDCGMRFNKTEMRVVDGITFCTACAEVYQNEMEEWNKSQEKFEGYNCDVCGKPIPLGEENGIQATVYCDDCFKEVN